MENMELVLKEQPFLKDLKADFLKILAACASFAEFKTGEIIFKENQEVDYLYLIRDGLVSIEILCPVKPIVTETLQANDVLGWSWLLPPYKAHFNCRAVKDTRVIALKGEQLRKQCGEKHDFGYELVTRLIKVVTHRLEATRIQLLNIYGN